MKRIVSAVIALLLGTAIGGGFFSEPQAQAQSEQKQDILIAKGNTIARANTRNLSRRVGNKRAVRPYAPVRPRRR